MDVYKISVELMLVGGLAEGLSRIAGQMTGLHGQIGKINAAFGGWGPTLAAVAGIGGIGLLVKGLDEVFDKTKKLSDQIALLKEMGASPVELGRVHQSF